MKKLLILSVLTSYITIYTVSANSEESNCNKLFLDIENGTLNKINLSASEKDIKNSFSCVNEEVKMGKQKSIFFNENGFSITLGEKITVYDSFFSFTGKISENLFKKNYSDIEKILGKPKYSIYRKVTEDKIETHNLYDKSYGTLDIKFTYGANPLVERVSIWSYKSEKVKKILGK